MAMKVFNVGDVLGAADVNEYLVNTKIIVKPGDTSRNTTTTLTNDPDLTIAVDANKTYFVFMCVNYTAQAGQDLKYTLTVPASATLNGVVLGTFVGTSFATQPYDSAFTAASVLHMAGQSVVETNFTIWGNLATSASAGNLTLQWSQNTSGGNNTTIRAGSFIYLRRNA